MSRLHSLPLGAPNPLRRKLLLGLPGGLALASPLALVACGGGDGEAAPAPAPGGTPLNLHDTGRAFSGDSGFTPVTVAIELPSGVVVPGDALAAHTLLGGFGVAANGSAALPLAFEGLQFVTVYGNAGLPILYGYVDATLPTLSVRSTATALIANALGASMFDSDLARRWIAEIDATPAAATLAEAIAQALRADVYALAASAPAIEAALLVAVRALLPGTATGTAARARPLGVTISPPDEASGAQPIIAQTLNTVYVQDAKLRRAWYVIHRESSVGADGQTVADPQRTVVAEGAIPTLPSFASAGGIITSVTTAVYSDDTTGLAFAKTPETALPLEPTDARSTTYSVTVLMAGNEKLGYDAQAAAQQLTATELERIEIQRFSTNHLGLQMLLLDLLVPMFLGWVGGKIGGAGADLGPREFKQKLQVALLGQLFGVLTSSLPAIVTKLQDNKTYPDYGVMGALGEIVANHLVVFVDVPVPGRAQPVTVPALSKFSMDMMILLLKYIAYEKLNAPAGEALLNFLEGTKNDSTSGNRYSWDAGGGKTINFDVENLQYAGIAVATKALATVDAGLGWIARTRMAVDAGSSRLYERWEVKVTPPKVRLRPDPLEIDPSVPSYAITAEIVDNDNEYGVEKGSITFDWTCTGLYGSLYSVADSGLAQPNRFTTSKNNATPNYLPSGVDVDPAQPETITATAYFEPIGSVGTRTLIGTATLKPTYRKSFTLKFNPPGPTDVPSDTDFGLTVAVKENVPSGSTVAWEWSRSGVGTLTDAPADANPANSHATFRSGANEGAAVVTVHATITVPAAYGKPSRIVICDPVSTTLNVKKGLKTLTFAGGWTIDTTYEPYVCGQCGPGGSPTNETGYSVVAYVVVPKVAGAKSYSVLLEKPTPDVRGGVPFPSTRTMTPPTLPGGWSDQGGSYWSGLSGGSGTVNRETGGGPDGFYAWMNGRFGDMKVTVTVTL